LPFGFALLLSATGRVWGFTAFVAALDWCAKNDLSKSYCVMNFWYFISIRFVGFVVACLVAASWPASAAPVTARTATSALRGWLHQDPRPLGVRLSSKVKGAEEVKSAAGKTLYYVVQLDPSGFVIIPADDMAGPVVAFSATGVFKAAAKSPLTDLVNYDMPLRIAKAQAHGEAAQSSKPGQKWHALLASVPNSTPDSDDNKRGVASQIRVAPFVQTLWNEGTDLSGSEACYNYYTPTYGAGNVDNYHCGCVATAMAQEMFYFRYPVVGVGTNSFAISDNGQTEMAQLRGGDGAGGPYQWNNMPLSPNYPTPVQASAIGSLTYDAGIAVNMDYTPDNCHRIWRSDDRMPPLN
jgi:hypothetical protein